MIPWDVLDLDPAWLFLSLIPGGIGFVLLFTIYPYFATSVVSLVGVGAVIGLALWYALQQGW